MIPLSSDKNEGNKLMRQLAKFTGLFYGLVSALFLSFSNVLIKKAVIFNGSEQAVIRYTFQLLIMAFIALATKNNLIGPAESRKILVIRGILGMTYLLALHFSVKLIAPSDSVSLLHLNIVIVSIMARFFLSEKINVAHILSVVLSLIGVFLIAQPSFLFAKLIQSVNNSSSINVTTNATENTYLSLEVKKMLGLSLALISSFAIACQSIILKKLSNQKVHYSISIIYGCYFGLPVSLGLSVLMFFLNTSNSSLIVKLQMNSEYLFLQLIYSIISAVCGVVSQILMNLALNHEDASKVSMLRSTEVFFTFLLQFILLNILKNFLSIIGAVLIVAGTFFILIYKMVDNSFSRNQEIIMSNKKSKNSNLMKFMRLFRKILLIKF